MEFKTTAGSRMNILVDAHICDGMFQGTRSYLEGLYKSIFKMEEHSSSGRVYYLAAHNIDNLKRIFPERSFIKYIQLKSERSYQRLIFEFPKIIKEYKIDYAHFQYVVPFYNKCNYIVTIHDLLFLEMPAHFSWIYRASRSIFFRRSYRIAHTVMTVSNYSCSSILKHYGAEKKIIVTPNAIEERIKLFNAMHSKDEWLIRHGIRPYILYVSRFEERKNHYSLLKAFCDGELYKAHDLLLIGKKSEKCPDFEALYQELPAEIKNHVILKAEGVDLYDLLEFMVHADIFIYPSLAEGFGIPPLEAAVLRTPVICSNSTAMKDFAFFGEDHVDCRSPENILTAIKRKLAQSPAELANKCELIRQAVLKTYDWDKTAVIFLDTVFHN